MSLRHVPAKDDQKTDDNRPDLEAKVKALVTGATGLVGANLVETLNTAGWQVRILRRRTSRLDALSDLAYEEAIGDILDEASLVAAMKGIDVVFHVAGAADYWRKPPAHLYRVNVDGTRCVVQAALQAGVERLVYTSSVAAIGPAPDPQHPVDETHPFTLPPHVFPYGHSKWLAEQEVQQGISAGLDAVIVNPSIVIGPRDVYLTSGSLFKGMERGMPFTPRGGSGVVDARDVALGHVRAAEHGRRGERYILSAVNLSHLALAREISRVLQVPPPRWELPPWSAGVVAWVVDVLRRLGVRLPADGNTIRLGTYWFYVDNRKSREQLHLSYRPVQEAIQDAVAWLKAHGYLRQRSR